MGKESITRRAAFRLCCSGPVSIMILALLFSSPVALASLPTEAAGLTSADSVEVVQRGSQNERQKNRYEQWQNMRPDEKETLRRRNDQWNRMAPQDQQRYQQRFNQWNSLSPDEQRQIDRKLEKWKDLSPSEKEDVRKRFR